MKIGICCIVKQENLYLRDWVKYYYDMGVSNIILYDNNDVEGEYPQQVIGDYISSGFVIYKDVRGKYRYQITAYNECYQEYKSQFDWIGFLDIDEYWYLSPEITFETFFSEERFPNGVAVFLNWLCYGDNEKLHYEAKPVYERFKQPTQPLEYVSHGVIVNSIKKVFLKCVDDVDFTFNEANDVVFVSTRSEPVLAYLANGEIYTFEGFTFENSYIKHYRTLTIEEFLYRRFGRRSYADVSSSFNFNTIMECFWTQNKWTQEKQDIIDKFFETFQIIEDNVSR